jgi:hypothetical protein
MARNRYKHTNTTDSEKQLVKTYVNATATLHQDVLRKLTEDLRTEEDNIAQEFAAEMELKVRLVFSSRKHVHSVFENFFCRKRMLKNYRVAYEPRRRVLIFIFAICLCTWA